MMQRINWTVQDAAELHASVLIAAAAAACAGSAKDTQLFLVNIAKALERHASTAASSHVEQAMREIGEILRETVPPLPLYQEAAPVPMRGRKLAS